MSANAAKPPSVWVVTECYPRPGHPGHCAFIHRQLRGLVEAGWNVRVFVPNGWWPPVAWRAAPAWRAARREAIPAEWHADEICVADLRIQNRVPSRWNRPLSGAERTTRALVRELRVTQRRPDVLLAQFALPYGGVVRAAALEHDIPYAVHLRGDDVWIWPRESTIKRSVFTEVVRDAAIVLAVSRVMIEEAERLASRALPASAVVANGIDLTRFRPAASASERAVARAQIGASVGEIVVVTVAAAIPSKGWIELLDALGMLAVTAGGRVLRLVGAIASLGAEIDLAAEAAARCPSVRLDCHRDLRADDLARVLRAADVFVLASHHEGMSNAVLEAMASGLPVIATRVGGHAEAIDDGVDGLLVAPRDVEALRVALDRMSCDSALRERVGSAARRRAEAIGDSRTAGARLSALLDGARRRDLDAPLRALSPYAAPAVPTHLRLDAMTSTA